MRPDPSVLRALLDRVRAAEGADRELDSDLFHALLTDNKQWWPSVLAGPYTGSIDAAVVLVERVCARRGINNWGFETLRPGCFEAYIGRNFVKSGHWVAIGGHKSIPCAFITALLTALIEEPSDA
jgi:hypothetical protein